ncbi:hypothetical protein M2354_000314 [Leclercia adecarboxylata]|nr:hypothetical protein [Leclercia adecarboxylata]
MRNLPLSTHQPGTNAASAIRHAYSPVRVVR